MDTPGNEKWGAVPLRAVEDWRLTAAQLRVLVLVARFYSFGKNGMGCTATRATIAKVADLDRTTVYRAIGKLIEYGYLEAASVPGKRRKQLVVRYQVLQGDHTSIPPKPPRMSHEDHTSEQATVECLQQSDGEVSYPCHTEDISRSASP